jgi:hypothetical protein
MTTDLKAVHHILFNSNDYPKPEMIIRMIGRLFGNGPLCCIIFGHTLMTLYPYRSFKC